MDKIVVFVKNILNYSIFGGCCFCKTCLYGVTVSKVEVIKWRANISLTNSTYTPLNTVMQFVFWTGPFTFTCISVGSSVCAGPKLSVQLKLKLHWSQTAVKRFSCFSQSQPVSAHVIASPPALAWRANSWQRLWLDKTAKTFHIQSDLFRLKLFKNSFETVLYSYILLHYPKRNIFSHWYQPFN